MPVEVTHRIEAGESADDQPDDVEKRAMWESLAFAVPCTGKVNVANYSYGDDEAKEHTYTVTVEGGRATRCTCPDHTYRGRRCKHIRAVNANEPVLMAASGRIETDGGQVLEESSEEPLPEITEHVEPERQGGATYIRCERCETEVIGTDPDRLVHREGCPYVEPGDFTLPEVSE